MAENQFDPVQLMQSIAGQGREVEHVENVETPEDSVETPEVEIPELGVEEEIETPEVQEEVETPEAEAEETNEFEDWDWEDETEPTTPEAVVDFTSVGKDLGVDTIKTKDDLVNYLSDLKTQLTEATKSKETSFEDVPEHLKAAIELAKNGGDYLQFLKVKSVDYSKVDPVALYERDVENYFTNPSTGEVDYDKVDSHLDSLPDTEKELRGLKLRNQLVQEQTYLATQLEQKATEQKIRNEQRLKEAIEKTDEVGGIKLKPDFKKKMFDDIQSGKAIKDMFHDANGTYDYNKVIDVYVKAKSYDKMKQILTQKVKTDTKLEVIKDLTNPEITKSIQQVDAGPKAKDPMSDWIEQLKGKQY
jgi:hypothetical protein